MIILNPLKTIFEPSMSTIFGILRLDNEPLEEACLEKMELKLNHWTADDTGYWRNEAVGFGHLLLRNSPESLAEKQPLRLKNTDLTITADARIDNRDELVIKLGITDDTLPDCSFILAAYQRYGKACVEHLIGDFAFAIWDGARQELFCARDQIGIRPFFYYLDETVFAFASEKKGLLALPELNDERNEQYLRVLTAFLDTKDMTCYAHIKSLPAAHTLYLQEKELELSRYWELDTTKEICFDNPERYHIELLALFEDAVRCRIRSAYPVGCELSGGLDSSAVTCIAASLLHRSGKESLGFAMVHPEKYRFEDMLKNDEYFVNEVRKFANLNVLEEAILHPDNLDFLEQIHTNLQITDGPHRVLPAWTDPIRKLAALHSVRTLLSGHGGDDLVTWRFGSYYFDDSMRGDWWGFIKNAASERKLKLAIIQLCKSVFAGIFPSLFAAFLKIKRRKALSSPISFLGRNWFDLVDSFINLQPDKPTDGFRTLQSHYFSRPFVSERMEAEVHAAKRFRMEPAFPMADIRLLQFVLSIPTDRKRGDRNPIFLKAMSGRLPPSVLKQLKNSSSPRNASRVLRNRLKQVKVWLDTLKGLNQLAPFIDIEKLMKLYIEGPAKLKNPAYSSRKALPVLKTIECILYWLSNQPRNLK